MTIYGIRLSNDYIMFIIYQRNNNSHLFEVQKPFFFSKFLMGGTQNFPSPSVPDGDEVGRGGGGDLRKNQTEAKTAHLMQN